MDGIENGNANGAVNARRLVDRAAGRSVNRRGRNSASALSTENAIMKQTGKKIDGTVRAALLAAKSDRDALALIHTSNVARENDRFAVNADWTGNLPSGPNAEFVYAFAVRLNKPFSRADVQNAQNAPRCAKYVVGRLVKIGAFRKIG
jgi:hypothetical protein